MRGSGLKGAHTKLRSSEKRAIGKSIAAAAVTGMLMACAGGAQALAKEPASDAPSTDGHGGAQNGCGNHEGGACGSIATPQPAKE